MSATTAADPAVGWLLRSREPAIRRLAARDLLDRDEVRSGTAVLAGPVVLALLAGQRSDGGFGVHPYRKWTGAHWRLVSLVELGVPTGEPRCVAAADTVLVWLERSRARITVVDGLVRRCASVEGNALAVCSRLGMASDPRVRGLAEALIHWQWPDGGWNCDLRASGRRSSFHESLPAMWGLHEYGLATGDPAAAEAAARTAELLLDHHVFLTSDLSRVIDSRWLRLRHPPYWHYDVLQAALVLARMGRGDDPRLAAALDHIESRQDAGGRWSPDGYWWSPPGSTRQPEAVDWGRSGPSEMLTLKALRVLRAAGRWSPGGGSIRP